MIYDHIAVRRESDFIDTSVSLLVEKIESSIEQFSHCIIGLSGGSTPKPIYEALGMAAMDWDRVTIFLVDDRYVPADHEDSNQKLIRETLLENASIPDSHIIFPDTDLPLHECIHEYDMRLAGVLSSGIPHMITLGLGEDGHIASLFPPVPEEAFKNRLVIHTETDQFAVHDRISTTMVVIGSAESKIFFLKGKGKKKTWEEMIASEEDKQRWPGKAAFDLGGGVVVSYW